MTTQGDSLEALVDFIGTTYPDLEAFKIMSAKTDDEFDKALDCMMEGAARYLEQNAKFLIKQEEDSITFSLSAYLTGSTFIRCIQQAYSRGHVDLTIESRFPPYRSRLGEAKIYKGPVYHVKGMEQLINRYSTGREGSGYVVEYVKDPKILDLVVKIRAHLDASRPCSQDGDTQSHVIRWAFITNHHHSSGEIFRVFHLNCNLYSGPSV